MRLYLLPLVALLTACGGSEPQESVAAADPSSPAAAEQQASSAPAADDFGLVSSRGTEGAAIPKGPASGAGLAYEFPSDWREEEPSSSMRFAQALLPGPGGDAQITLFFFGVGGGGGVEANLERWVGQMGVAPGTTPERGSFDAGQELNVTWVEVSGTVKASGMGMGPSTDQPGSRLLGAVVVGIGGPWFIKVTGPEETVKAQRESIMAFLKGLRRRTLDEPMGAP